MASSFDEGAAKAEATGKATGTNKNFDAQYPDKEPVTEPNNFKPYGLNTLDPVTGNGGSGGFNK
jgi:hypothetical protein